LDAIALLTADHNRVRGLFTRFKAAHEAEDTGALAEIAATIFTELTVHTEIEEQIFYPRVHELSEEVGETVDEGLEEHHVVKVLMGEIKELEPSDDKWVAKMQVLIENVEHHAEEEETELFPSVRSKMDADSLTRLAEKLEAGKSSLGAPTLADKIDLPKDELLNLAREQEIPGRSKMDREELAATVAPA
jgi:hemerythrin superfamily protein